MTVVGAAITVATANPKKLAELASIFAEVAPGAELAPRPDGLADVDETGETLEANAELKARAVAAAAGTAALADDTGLEVDALDGAPGVRSARFAGDPADDAANVSLLLDRLAGIEASRRTARFRTVICLATADGAATFAEGICEGVIADSPRGDAGFGYDPVFVPVEGDGRTFAEMSPDEKHAISHRGRALRAAGPMIGEAVAAPRGTGS